MAVMITQVAFQAKAAAWWNEQWKCRKKITLDTTAGGMDIQENLSDVTVLIRLHSGNFSFPDAMERGEDIRFVNSNDQDLLKHHIERFDIIDEIALVWVKIPQLAASSRNFIWMYYGNKEAAAAGNPEDSFSANTVAAYHFGELEGVPQDQTANQNHPAQFSGGQGLPSVIGNGIALNGAGDRMVLPASPTMNFAAGFTFSGWIRLNAPQADAYLFSMSDDGNGQQSLVIGINGLSLQSTVAGGTDSAVTVKAASDLSLNTWHHLTVTAGPGRRLAVYLDGEESNAAELSAPIPQSPRDTVIGGALTGGHALIGELDEITISNTARSAGWVRTRFGSQGPDNRLVTFGPEEIGGGGGLPVFYLATIMKNITLDGWVVIIVLGLLGAVSWITFLTKAFLLWMARRDNKAFLKDFSTVQDLKNLKDGSGKYMNSGLFRVFNTGLETLTGCLSNPEMCFVTATGSGNPKPAQRTWLNRKGMNAFKAGLERGFIEETQQLNAWLVLLTLAITGGPFLGLLGTVWGVMNTFAAMAEAGEANIMAIAPGVASALSTTVIGLIVAIPALFSYNYLTGKIKDMTANLTIFIDQYAVKVDQLYGGTHETPNL